MLESQGVYCNAVYNALIMGKVLSFVGENIHRGRHTVWVGNCHGDEGDGE